MLPNKHHDPVDGFRWRSHEITRIEGFSDAVFGFAVTLLIVSLEVPRTSTELLATMRGFGSFVVTFLILAGMWYMQHTFFRRYGLEDRVTVVLNLVLLFTVLFFVYPMKFLFTTMFNRLLTQGPLVTTTAHGIEPLILPQHRPLIFMIFGAGFTAVFMVFVLLYRHAYKQRDKLELNEFEIFETRHSIRRMLLACGVGVTYFAIAAVEAMPHRTNAEKQNADTFSIAIVAILGIIMVAMFRALRHRRRVTREWKNQVSGVQPGSPAERESLP
jgi:uncharacterized membrane protein